DIIYMSTVDGLHKDDLKFKLNDNDASLYASQGQQRSIVLAIKTALLEIVKKEIGEYPILLLDDVLSELDDQRKMKMMNLIDHKVQTFITTTSIEGIQHASITKAKKIKISHGNKEDI
ncbi:MAG: DNA replication and repair protein RecF, partial [Sharpea porci]